MVSGGASCGCDLASPNLALALAFCGSAGPVTGDQRRRAALIERLGRCAPLPLIRSPRASPKNIARMSASRLRPPLLALIVPRGALLRAQPSPDLARNVVGAARFTRLATAPLGPPISRMN